MNEKIVWATLAIMVVVGIVFAAIIWTLNKNITENPKKYPNYEPIKKVWPQMPTGQMVGRISILVVVMVITFFFIAQMLSMMSIEFK